MRVDCQETGISCAWIHEEINVS